MVAAYVRCAGVPLTTYRFSGDVDGFVTSEPANFEPAGAGTSVSSTNSAAAFIAGYAWIRRNCVSREN
jgi:hypothetical protein